jgi:hypothetical protein
MLREKLAEIQHAIWAHWMTHLLSVSTRNEDGTYTIPADKVEQWKRQMHTPYSELSEYEKESDRDQADTVLAVLEEDVSDEQQKRVFLSYSASGDEGTFVHNVVEHLYQDLTANGYEVWGYERKSTIGEDFREKYKQVIQESNFFVVFCNETARQSEYIKDEIKTAVDCIKTKAIKIIPVQLDKENPHPLLDQLYLPAIPYYDKERRNRVYLLHRLLTAMGASLTTPPGDKFSALGQVWKVYQRDPMNYPIYNPDSIRLLGSEGSRMDIQTEGDFTYGSLQLEVESKWRTDTSVGFEKWYGRDRYSITLQGDGNVWVRWPGLLWGKSEHFPVANWRQIRQEPIVLRIDWSETETAVFANDIKTCRTRTRIHRPLKLRMNADFNDYLIATKISWPEK